jgi:hypothetical protein
MWSIVKREPTRQWRATGEFVIVWGEFGAVRVSRTVGAWIADQTSKRWPPRWLEFVDLAGSLIRLQPREVDGMHDSSPRVRARMKAHRDAMEAEMPDW